MLMSPCISVVKVLTCTGCTLGPPYEQTGIKEMKGHNKKEKCSRQKDNRT